LALAPADPDGLFGGFRAQDLSDVQLGDVVRGVQMAAAATSAVNVTAPAPPWNESPFSGRYR
jgi:hypothetical protein